MSSSATPAVPPPRNMRPRLQRPLAPLAAFAGKPFSHFVPAETFVDFEDGETPELALELEPPEPADSWLQFSGDDQRFYGL